MTDEDTVADAYPFPDDELLYYTGTGFTDRRKHSYTAIGVLPENHRLEVNGAPHNNSHRLVIHTPIRGPVSFLTRPLDMEGLLLCALRLAVEGEGVLGPKGELHLHQRWLEDNLGGPIEWHPRDDDPVYVEPGDGDGDST